MKSVRTLATASVTLLAGAVACDRQVETGASRLRPTEPSFALVVDQYATYTPRQNANGVYLLDRLCDVFIGEPEFEAPEVPQKYAHQTVVVVPQGARIRVVGTPEMNRAGSKTFVCDARDDNGQPLIDPVTLHAAKGDGPQIFTDGVTLDMSGYSLTVSPALGEEPGFENIGIGLIGSNITLMNSSTVDVAGADDLVSGRKPGVTRVWGFGHNVDVEAELNPTVRGRRYDADGATPNALSGSVFNFESQGGFGVRLSGGSILITQVKSVNLDPVEGQGFEARRSLPGSQTTVTNSYFEGGAQGAFIREYSGITFQNNHVVGHAGPGISTREAASTIDAPIYIRNNLVENSTIGILWGRESVNAGDLRITGNTINTFTTCGIGLSTDDASLGNQTLATIASRNTFGPSAAPRTCVSDD